MPIDDDSMVRIRRIQASYADAVKAIQGDRNLSGHGKGRTLAILKHRTETEIAGIRAAAEDAYGSEVTRLQRKMFGIRDIPQSDYGAAMSYRDAQDRVAEIKNGAEAQLLMRRADRDGDHLLARALFDRGWQMAGDRMAGSGWGQVVREYIAKMRPDLAADVEDLAKLQNVNTRERRLNEQMQTSVFTPPEVAAMSPGDVRQAIGEQGGDSE